MGNVTGFVVRATALHALLSFACFGAAAAPSIDEARYMSAECARMADAIRNAPRVYPQPRSFQDLRNAYAEQCGLEEARARRKAMDAKRRNWDKEWEAQAAEERQRRQAEDATVVRSAQCQEMHLALVNRRKRAAANPGEANDLQMFEQRYSERCN